MTKNSLKLFLGFLFVGCLSAVIAVAFYSQINKKETANKSAFAQSAFKTVSYGDSTGNAPDFTLAAERTIHGVVHIKSTAKAKQSQSQPYYFNPFDFFGDRTPNFSMPPRIGYGSGVIISSDGYIITNNHVIDGADEVEVNTNDNKTFTAKIIGKDDVSDLALIKIETDGLTAIPFGDSDKLKVGEWVLAVGNPFNLTSTVTAGIVSAKGRGDIPMDPSDRGKMRVTSYIQTDAAVNRGNSGGALVNTRGELVGINSAIYSESGLYAGYSFAIPTSIVIKVANDLKQYGTVQRAVLGVSMTSIPALKEIKPDDAKKLKVTEGAYVSEFSAESAAKNAGIQVGDVIIQVNDATIKTPSDLQEQINRYKPGETVKVVVQRGDTQKTFHIELKNRKGNTEIVKEQSPAEMLGATFQELSDQKKKEFGINFGIEVNSVSTGKFKEASIGKGFILMTANDVKIKSVEDLNSVIEDVMQREIDDRGLYLKGFYPGGNNVRVKFYAINLAE